MTKPEPPKIEFPCDDYVIKVVGDVDPTYKPFVASVLSKFDSKVTVEKFKENPSRNGRFVSLTIRMKIEKEEHLKLLFEELQANKLVRMVL
jgi:putative lipoic acid-binding regulatory protein